MLLLFFFNDTATTEIYTLSLHDALPISIGRPRRRSNPAVYTTGGLTRRDRKSTRLNSSHDQISYAVFCLQKKTSEVGGRGRRPPAQLSARPVDAPGAR